MRFTVNRSAVAAIVAALGLGLSGCQDAATRHQTNRIDAEAERQKEQLEQKQENIDRNAEAQKDQVRAQEENREKAAEQQAENLREKADNLEKRADQVENPPANPAPQ